jgi:hypothetical protein
VMIEKATLAILGDDYASLLLGPKEQKFQA